MFEQTLLTYWHRVTSSNASLTLIGLLIVGLLAADIILPTPSSLVSLAAALTFGALLGSILIFVGMSICCLLGYYLGRCGHSISIEKTDNNKTNQSTTSNWLQRWGPWSLLLSRPIPVLAETSVVMAGVTKLPLRKFLLYTIPANAIISAAYGLSAVFIS
ncbi:MAG: 3-dehydroquinate synthase [Gammaproteobacteria bacterium]|jgi:3-dehydroquinate synthase